MPGLLEGKTALVLGIANKWSLAYAIAEAFRREGARLVITYQGDRQRETVLELASQLGALKTRPCDLSTDEDLTSLITELKSANIYLDVIVHSIAYAFREELSRPFLETSREGFLVAHEISVYSLIAVARAALPLMNPGASIITLSYLGAHRVIPNYNVMGLAKAALESAVRYLASELGPAKGIRVNAISAGPVKTVSARAVKDFSSMLDFVAQRAPLRHNTEPAEVGDVAVFLASHLARGVTANVIYVDSGFQAIGL